MAKGLHQNGDEKTKNYVKFQNALASRPSQTRFLKVY